MEEEIRAKFKRSGFTFEEDQILKKCLTFCVNYNLKPSDIILNWEVYCLNRQLDGSVVQNAQMDGFLQHLQHGKKEVVIKAEPDLHVYPSKDVDMILDDEVKDPKEDVRKPPNGRVQNLHKEQFDSTPLTNGGLFSSGNPSKHVTPFDKEDDRDNNENGIIKKVQPLRSYPLMVHGSGSGSGPETHCRFMNGRIEEKFNASDNGIMKPSKALVVSGQYGGADRTVASQEIYHDMDPGPINDSMLNAQHRHRSQLVWEDDTTAALHCRRRENAIGNALRNHPRIEPYLRQSGFYGVSRIAFIQLDWHLITAFVERWRPETHTFHLPIGECTITIQDVAVQFGLPVDGGAVIGSLVHNWVEMCQRLLGVTPGPAHLKGSRLSLPWLSEQFQELADDADELTVQRYARAYILQLLGGVVLTDKSNNLVHLMYLPLLEDFKEAGKLSWGGACLAWLYRELCKAANIQAADIAGPLVLLQIWAWDRFPTIAPRRLHRHEDALQGRPLGVRWNDTLNVTEVSTHVLVQYRYMLDRLTLHQIVWEPYRTVMDGLPESCLQGQDIWMTTTPLICFFVVEWHFPNRVMRQFGRIQSIPSHCDTEDKLHQHDLRGRHIRDWRTDLAVYIGRWDARRDTVVHGDLIHDNIDVDPEYMSWYSSRTRRFITRAGAAFDFVTRSFTKILSYTQEDETRAICQVAASVIDDMSSMYRVRQPAEKGRKRGRRSREIADLDLSDHDILDSST